MVIDQTLLAAQNWVMRQDGWRRVGIAFLCGSLSVLAMAPFFFWPVLFVTLPVLVWLLDRENVSVGRAFRDAWWFGFGYFFFGLFWIGEAFLVEAEKFAFLLPFAITLLPAGLALFFGVGAVIAKSMWRPGLSRVLILAVALAMAEWLRGNILTGLPWNTLGYALTQPLPLMQMASVFGVYGLTLWVVLICASPAVLVVDALGDGRAKLNRFAGVAIAAVLLLLGFSFGWLQLSTATSDTVANVKVRLVQPAIAQKDKWETSKRREIFDTLLELSRSNEDGGKDNLDGITHVIWPEAAIPFLILRTPQALTEIADLLPDDTVLLTGALRLSDNAPPVATDATPRASRKAFNSLMAFNGSGLLVGLTDKTHLVPFGEFLPLQSLFESVGLQQLTKQRGGFSPGKTPRSLFPVAGIGLIAPLICYEAIFPEEIVQDGKRPNMMLNLTNDAWFGDTTGPRQHFHQNRVRAVEQGVPLVRVANGGISAVIDSYGRIRTELGLNKKGVLDSALPVARPPTVYVAFGDIIAAITALLFLLAGGYLGRNKKNRFAIKPKWALSK